VIVDSSNQEEKAQRRSYDSITIVTRASFYQPDDRVVGHHAMSPKFDQNLARYTYDALIQIKMFRGR
jgi:hypothetical protein